MKEVNEVKEQVRGRPRVGPVSGAEGVIDVHVSQFPGKGGGHEGAGREAMGRRTGDRFSRKQRVTGQKDNQRNKRYIEM